LKSSFVANFHHFKATLLSGENLINAFRTFFIQINTESKKEEQYENGQNRTSLLVYVKLAIITFLLGYFHWVFTTLGILVLYIVLFDIVILVILGYLWFKESLFYFTKTHLTSSEKIRIVHPFNNVSFYRTRSAPNTLFLYVNQKLLIGLQVLNLKYVESPPFVDITNFYQVLINQNIPHAYTVFGQPLNFYQFYKNGTEFLNDDTKAQLMLREKSELQAENWMSMRCGMWNTTLNIAVTSFQYIDQIIFSDLNNIEDKLLIRTHTLKGIFDMNFNNFELVPLQNQKLIAGYLFSTLKNNKFRHQGTHLNYVMLQGLTLTPLTTLSDALKKGLETRIAAEFNTPLHLENDIVIGNTVNTEVIEKEIPVGFTYSQVKNLLVVGGAFQYRQQFLMKYVAELIKADIPSIVFDFNGQWSRLIPYFKGTEFENKFVFFKAGTVFNLDLTHSDIAYDTNNISFIDYMVDTLSLALKKDEHTIAMLRNTIMRNPEMDLHSLNVELQTQNDWEKGRASESLLSLLSEFTQQDMVFFQRTDASYAHKIYSYDFIKSDKTVIIDLSLTNKIPKQLFISFLIISKIIHYLSTSDDYFKKILVIPYIDLFFDSIYLDRRRNYGLINRIFDPLLKKGFGFTLSANQIHYLHPNVFTYFENIMAFRSTDGRDIAILSRLMNLQELEGRGYYSRSRNQTYQIRYLETMNNNEVILKRSDNFQTFPVIIDWEDIEMIEPVPYKEVIAFMEDQGYNPKHAEQTILELAKQTLFEKDLGAYFSYMDEVILFLKQIKQVDGVGNLYKSKLKDQLKEIIYPKASKKTSKKENIKKIRDELFTILLRQGYLVEAHPNKASGSESLRTSYRVGEQFEKATEDYFRTKASLQSDLSIEVIESEKLTAPQPSSRSYIVKAGDIKKAFAREISDLNFELFNIYSYINRKDYKNALKIEEGLIYKFLVNVYSQFYNVNYIITSQDLEVFFEYLSSVSNFPFTKDTLQEYIDKLRLINFEEGNFEVVSVENYQLIYTFFIEIQKFIYSEQDEGVQNE
jgi:hypothetical protein